MKDSIHKLRVEYGNASLRDDAIQEDPYLQFRQWLEEAINAEVMEPNGMVLSTVSATGAPSSRTVLLKKLDSGFVFFTNYGSRKGRQLELDPCAALTFWWKEIYRQVNIEGKIAKVSRKESLAYFNSRPRGAQLAALASEQSAPLGSRFELEEAFKSLEKKYVGKKVPCPEQWGGFRLIPDRFEFWQGHAHRLHDRFLYVKTDQEKEKWLITRLAP